jgi:chitosanase
MTPGPGVGAGAGGGGGADLPREDIGDGRGYTAGVIGFCSGTGDTLELVQAYTAAEPGNPLAAYLPALQKANGSDSHSGLGTGFVNAWKAAAEETVFRTAQNHERDRVYFNPAVNQAKADGLRTWASSSTTTPS